MKETMTVLVDYRMGGISARFKFEVELPRGFTEGSSIQTKEAFRKEIQSAYQVIYKKIDGYDVLTKFDSTENTYTV